MKAIITKQDIINTYDERQQEQCRLYYEYKKIKQENPSYGYKRIAKLLGHSYGKTRWWHCGRHTPVPIQTAEWLEERSIIPLESNNPNLFLLAKVLGATFGDGGIFGNLNGIFLSSSELEAVQEFGEDLKRLFGEEIEENSRIIEGGEYGHSWCYQNTNRSVIRLFQALGAPIGDKAQIELKVPKWIQEEKETIQDEFFGSLLGGELGVPKIHIDRNRLDLFSLGITGSDKFAENRISFLSSLGIYLNNKGIRTGKISLNDHKKVNRKGEPTKIYRLLISTEFENLVNFKTRIKISYCVYKPKKLANTINQFAEIKRKRYKDLILMGYKKEAAKTLLKLSPAAWLVINNKQHIEEEIITTK